MKKSTTIGGILLLSVFVLSTGLHAQKSKGSFSAKFEDGTVIDYDVMQNHPDDLFKKQITALGTTSAVGQTAEISFAGISPARFQYKAGINYGLLTGFAGFHAGGMWFFLSGDKAIKQSCSVRSITSGNTTTKYVVKVDATKGKYFGAHGELGYNRIGYGDASTTSFAFNGGNYTVNSVSYGSLSIGLGYVSMRGVQVKVKESQGGHIGGSRVFTAVADLVIYPGVGVKSTPLDSIANTHPLEGGDISNGMIGFRVYAQAHTTFLYHKKKGAPNGCLGLTWRLGIAKAPYVAGSALAVGDGVLAPVFGLGLFYTIY